MTTLGGFALLVIWVHRLEAEMAAVWNWFEIIPSGENNP
jgi:hypothetical protein